MLYVKCLKALTAVSQTPIVHPAMNDEEQLGKGLRQLEAKVEDLIGVCRRLKEENDTLRGSRDSLLEEKSKLAEKNRMARTRLETIVTRLKALDKHQ